MAPPKESQVKESSVIEASETPSTIGTSESTVSGATREPRMSAERKHVKTGSAALTICVKETAPAPAETTAPMWPIEWQKAIGRRVWMASRDRMGALRMPVSQSGMTKAEPTKSEKADWHHGSGSRLRRTLFCRL